MNPHHHDLSVARRRMVEEQLRTRGIHDPHVLRIMQAMPRHLFVDDTLSASASRARWASPLIRSTLNTASQSTARSAVW